MSVTDKNALKLTSTHSSLTSTACNMDDLTIEIAGSNCAAGPGPVLIFLHGYGEDASAWEPFARRVVAAAPMCRVLLPRAPVQPEMGGKRSWFVYPRAVGASVKAGAAKGVPEALQLLDALVGAQLRRGCALQQVLLGGFSQGAGIALMGSLRPRADGQRFGAVLGLSTALPTLSGVAVGEAQRATPVLLLHGGADKRVPAAKLDKTLAVLRRRRGSADGAAGDGLSDARLQTFGGLGHSRSDEEAAVACEWLAPRMQASGARVADSGGGGGSGVGGGSSGAGASPSLLSKL